MAGSPPSPADTVLDAPSDSELEAGPAKKVETGPPPKPPLLKQPLPPGLVRRGPVSAGAQAQGAPGPEVAKDAAVMWLKGPVSDWERQRQKRIRILELLKTKPAYQAFNSEWPRESRDGIRQPLTPDPTEPCSKRRWETRFQTFKSRMNDWFADRYPEEEQTGAGSSTDALQEAHCDDPRHYALSVCCPHAGLRCSCQDRSSGTGN